MKRLSSPSLFNNNNIPRTANVSMAGSLRNVMSGGSSNTFTALTTINGPNANNHRSNLPFTNANPAESSMSHNGNQNSENIMVTVSRLANIADQLQKSMEVQRSEEFGISIFHLFSKSH